MVRWVVSALLVTLLLLSLVILSSANPIGGTNPTGVYGCRVNGNPSTSCTIGTSNCARYHKDALSDPWSGATYDDANGDTDTYHYLCGQDCNDGDGNIHPGAAETCGNNIDEDCDGFDTACPFSVSLAAAVSDTTVTLTATTNYKASCCFAPADTTYADYTACDAGTHLAVLTTTGSDPTWTAATSTTQTAGTTKTYTVYCKAPP